MSRAADLKLADELRDAFEGNDLGTDDDILDLWNEFAATYDEAQMCYMDDLQGILMDQGGYTLTEIIDMLDPKFNTEDEYWSRDRMGYLVSYSDWYDKKSPWNLTKLIKAIVNDKDSFGSHQVQRILDEFSE